MGRIIAIANQKGDAAASDFGLSGRLSADGSGVFGRRDRAARVLSGL